MQQSEEIGHDILHAVGDKHLIAIKLNLVATQIEIILNLGKVEHTGKIERVVHVEVNPEQRLIVAGIELTVELLVVFVLEVSGLTAPDRLQRVDNIVLVGFLLLAVLPLGLLAKSNLYR